MNKKIPVIDLFAGPGGLGEGFEAVLDNSGSPVFKVSLSIEHDAAAHKTLELRRFFRQFHNREIPEDYYFFLQGKITLDNLYSKYPHEADNAKNEAWCASLGSVPEAEVLLSEKQPGCRLFQIIRFSKKTIILQEFTK